jgi:hypothetical protein
MYRDDREFKYNPLEAKGCFIFHVNMRDLHYVNTMIAKMDALIRA